MIGVVRLSGDDDRKTAAAVGVLKLLAEVCAAKPAGVTSGFEVATARWGFRLVCLAAGMFVVLLVLAVAIHLGVLSKNAGAAGLVVGIGVELAALASLVLNTASALAAVVTHHRRGADVRAAAFAQDLAAARRLAVQPSESRRLVEGWLEQEIQRMERRLVRFFGGSDKVALVALAGAGWAVWKEIGSAITAWEPSLLLYGAAALMGLAVGSVASAAQAGLLMRQRDLLKLAISLALEDQAATELKSPPLGAS